jgi:hypothetical protein
MTNPDLITSPQSGASVPVVGSEATWVSSSGSTVVLSSGQTHTPRRWGAGLRSLWAAANLAVADAFDPTRRNPTDISHYSVIVLGDETADIFVAEPESVFTLAHRRATLWINQLVPILPRRRAFFGASPDRAVDDYN